MAQCEDFPCCGHELGDCMTNTQQHTVECQAARLSAKIATPFQERIEHLARLGERHALWMLTGVPGSDQWHDVVRSLDQIMHEKAVLERQAAWINRLTAWVIPNGPAWVD